MRRPFLNALRARRVAGLEERAGLRLDHPLVCATEAVQHTGRQWVHVAAVLVGSVIAVIERRAWATPLAVSAGTVLLVLTVILAACEQRKRDWAIELILEGRESAPIPAVQRQRDRLISERTRDSLAANLEEIVCQASNPRRRQTRATRPLFEPMIVATVTDELREVIRLLRAGGVSARGVAQTERLVTHGVSPLYGHEVSALREELWRVRDLLKD